MNVLPFNNTTFQRPPRLLSVPAWIILLVVGLSSCSVAEIRGYYTPEEAYQNASALAGRRIVIQGKVEIVSSMCTEVACPPDNPCCNECENRLGFHLAQYRSIYISGKDSACAGNSCRMECQGLQPGGIYQVTGVLRDQAGIISFELQDWKTID
jgi:hypothetical protein